MPDIMNNIVIIGGGLGGLTAGALLSKKGIRRIARTAQHRQRIFPGNQFRKPVL